ncbi:hypothetical protein C2S51_004249 [Perilla frutescens var. frutescens]|nr:hypothetical protein C2S51_004249 [Perilla frutescens var. frutescens]
MSSQDEDRRSLDEGSESPDDVSMMPKISYSREFLLSISDLDICKKLPSGFDEPLLSGELDESLLRIPDRPRIPASSPFQGFRRNEHASSPPTRGDTSTYSRGVYGKWESRSSARSDRDSDSQSDKDSDSGKRFGHQSRRSWQTPEHDGLLGSGSFPRPSGYAAGISAAKVRTNEQNQLSRSSEPYHPPRPYKAVPHSRRDTDAYNDETFGSLECDNEDRAEQERRRRASFEMMRKEQHKALQEKQNSNIGKNKGGDGSNLFDVLLDSKEEKGLVRNNESEVSVATPILSDSEKSALASQAPASRLLVPPGFKSTPLEKSSALKSLIHPSLPVVGKPVTSESTVDADPSLVRNANDGVESQLPKEIGLVGGQSTEKTQHTLLSNKGENVNVHVSLDGPKQTVIEDQLLRIPSHLDNHEMLDNPAFTELNAEVLEDRTVRDSSRSHPTSILEKIFGSTSLSTNDGYSSSAELHSSKPEDAWSPKSVHSSKFAQWFSEEEAKAVDDVSSTGENNLLSLIVGGDKANGISDQACSNNKDDAVPTVLTCEDLEQSILSEYSAKTTKIQPDLKSWSAAGGDIAQPSGHADNHASLHLLSMLQKNADQTNTTVNSVNINLADKQIVSREHDRATTINKPKGEENGNLGKSLTLEALFGTAFMNELQSVEAPVSVHRGSTGSALIDAPESHAFPFPVGDNDISSSTVEKTGLQRPTHDYNVSSNPRHHAKLSGAENWLSVGNSSIGISSPKRQTEAVNKHGGFERNVGYRLPEEENLISAGDSRDPRVFPLMPGGNSINNANSSSSTPINITEKLAAFGAVIKDKYSMEGSENMPFPRDSYEQMGPDISYSNLQLQQQSSPHLQPPHITQARPLYHHLESHPAHMSSHLKFLGPEPSFNHDSPANQQFSSSMVRPSFHHPGVRVSGFDVPPQHSVLHHMHVPGNHPPHFARGGPVPQHGNQSAGFVQEMNQMQGLPFGPCLPNIGGGGVPMPGNPPEAFQRLIEMELRANSKQIHPFAPPGHSQGIYSHELDMESRYR